MKKLISLLMGLLFILGCNFQNSSQNAFDVQVAVAKTQDINSQLNVSGALIPAKTVNIYSKLTGQVEKVNVEVGSEVKKGSILAQIETKALNIQLEQLQASLESAKAAESLAKGQVDQAKINLDSMEKAYEKTKDLYSKGLVTKDQLDEIATKYELAKKQYETVSNGSLKQAKAALDVAYANMKNVKLQIENSKIVSPISGIVINKNINVGELASPTVPLFVVGDFSALKLKGTISQKYLPYVKVGQTIDVIVDIYPNKIYKGQIVSVGPMAVSTGMYFPIEISIKNVDNIKPGLSAHAVLNISKKGIVVPSSALVRNNGKNYVYVIENNLAKKREVEVGLQNNREVEIISGLKENEKVAISNVNNLFDNAVVNIK